MCKIVLERAKRLLLWFPPLEHDTLLCQLMQRHNDGAEIFDKAAIETCRTKKTLNLCDGLGLWPAVNSLNFFVIHLNTLWSNNIAKKRDSIGAKGALLKVIK